MISFVYKNIPNLLTLLNLSFGYIGIIEVLNKNIFIAEICFWIGLFMDFLDGFMARLLKSDSKIGTQLDSLADMITSGILPGLFIYSSLMAKLPVSFFYLKYIALIIPAFTAIRLARFNIELKTKNFKGLPSPAAACFIIYGSILSLNSDSLILPDFVKNCYFLIFCSIAISYLLVSKYRFIALKFEAKSFLKNKRSASILLFVLIVSFIFVLILRREGIFLIISSYILISFFLQKTSYLN